jgi:hypothetical protein
MRSTRTPVPAPPASWRQCALGRAGGPKAAQLLWQIYEGTSAGSVTQMACIAALGESARGF